MYIFICIYCARSFSEETVSFERGETLSLDDKLEIVSECWIEPVNGTVVNCTSELSRFNDSDYSHIPDVVSRCSLLLSFSVICYLHFSY